MPAAMIVLAHPNPESFNHGIAAAIGSGFARAGLDVCTRDLYAEHFDPLARAAETNITSSPEEIFAAEPDKLIAEHRRDLAAATVLAVVHPNWWGKPPAIMSGWIDRVIVPGVAYSLDDAIGVPRSILTLKSLYVVNTSDTTPEREAKVFGDPLQLIWEQCVGTFLGASTFDRRILRTVSNSSPSQRQGWLDDVRADASRIGAETN